MSPSSARAMLQVFCFHNLACTSRALLRGRLAGGVSQTSADSSLKTSCEPHAHAGQVQHRRMNPAVAVGEDGR